MTSRDTRQTSPIESVMRPFAYQPARLSGEETQIRAEARLEQILATPPEQVPHTVDTPRWRRRRTVAIRWASIPLVAAAVALAGVVVPTDGGLLRLAQPLPAFASWTAEPGPVARDDLARAESACRAPTTGSSGGHLASSASLVASEQRGNWPVLVFEGPAGRDVCLLEAEPTASSTRVALISSTGSANLGGRPVVVSSGEAADGEGGSVPVLVTSVAPTGIRLTTTLYTSVADEGALTLVDGVAGADVSDVIVHTSDDRDVTATVESDRFVAWWPTSAVPASYTVTLRDGTVLEGVQPTP